MADKPEGYGCKGVGFSKQPSIGAWHGMQLSIAILERPLHITAEGWLLITAAIGYI
jgi:hypothetical protein